MKSVFRPLLTLVCVLTLAVWSVGCGDKGSTTGAPAGTGDTAAAGQPADGQDEGQTDEPQTAAAETAESEDSDDSDDFDFFDFGSEGGSALGDGGFGFDDN